MGLRTFSSCFQCVALRFCARAAWGRIGREEARRRAATCPLPERGLGTETVKVLQRDRGVSRRNAVRLVREGLAVWVDHEHIQLLAEPPVRRAQREVTPAPRSGR